MKRKKAWMVFLKVHTNLASPGYSTKHSRNRLLYSGKFLHDHDDNFLMTDPSIMDRLINQYSFGARAMNKYQHLLICGWVGKSVGVFTEKPQIFVCPPPFSLSMKELIYYFKIFDNNIIR